MEFEVREPLVAALIAIALAALLSLTGCAYPRSEIGLWHQRVAVTAYGISATTPYGLINFGYVHWQRNVDEPVTVPRPVVPLPGE